MEPSWEEWMESANLSGMLGPQVTESEIGDSGIFVADDPAISGPHRLMCPADVFPLCGNAAGKGTEHPGVGRCARHGGKNLKGRREAALLMAHALARRRDTTPWQALLDEVQRCAGAVAWLDWKVGQAPDDDALLSAEPGVGFAPWVAMRERYEDRLAKVAKMTMDAGVASALVARAEVSGQATARVLMNTLGALGLTEDQMDLARTVMRRELLAIASEEGATVIDGSVVETSR
jgi:hypothetical protein